MLMVSRGLGPARAVAGSVPSGATIPESVPPLTRRSWFGRLGERLRSKARWREIAHHLLQLPVSRDRLRRSSSRRGADRWRWPCCPPTSTRCPDDAREVLLLRDRRRRSDALAAPLVVGVIGLAVRRAVGRPIGAAPRAVGARRPAARADARTSASPNRSPTCRRAGRAAVDSAEAERRRIERDLHDGAQQRLVALAADLGRGTREARRTTPRQGGSWWPTAHEEAKAALKEIRDLVRGIHPVILEDRGLDAALSAVVARSPVPVAPRRRTSPSDRRPAVESAAYFVVNEALTNVARHARRDAGRRRHRPAGRPARRRGPRRRPSAAPMRRQGTGLQRPARPGRRARRHDARDQSRRAARPRSCVELPCGS